MKLTRLALFLVVIVLAGIWPATPHAAAAPAFKNLTGTWLATSILSHHHRVQSTLVLVQTGTTITGTLTSLGATWPLTGTISGHTFMLFFSPFTGFSSILTATANGDFSTFSGVMVTTDGQGHTQHVKMVAKRKR